MSTRSSRGLLLRLLNSLADFDGHISQDAAILLNKLRLRSDRVPPLCADVFGLTPPTTCADLVKRIESLTEEQVAIASYAFQVFRYYEQLLRVDTTSMASKQKAATEAQLERVRRSVERTKLALAEAIGNLDNP